MLTHVSIHIDQQAGGLTAGGIALHPSPGWGREIPGNTEPCQPQTVQNPGMARTVREAYGMVRGRDIEVPSRRMAPLGQLKLVIAVSHQPLAGWQACGCVAV